MEVLGVKRPIREVTDRLSREDDVAVAPALYHCLGSNPYAAIKDALARTLGWFEKLIQGYTLR